MTQVLRQINDELWFISPCFEAKDLVIHEFNGSNIALVAYDRKTDCMYVQYSNGKMYEYRGLPFAIFEKLDNAKSASSWVSDNIKSCFTFSDVTGVKAIIKPVKAEIVLLVDKLQHHRDTTVGLWATDRPDLVKDSRDIMFQITG